MQTLGSALDEHKGFAQGFDFLRVLLATSIIGWHAAQLSAHVEMVRASVFWFTEYMLVPMFFALSGFLVAGSSMRLSTKNFLLNRAARILPALAADIVFAALLIGPLVTTLTTRQYFSDPTFFSYFLNITGWMQYELPGVFENNPRHDVNGSLWTVPFEMGCYVMLAGLMISGAIKRPRLILLLTFAVLMAGVHLMIASSHLASNHPSPLENLAMSLFLFKGALLLPSFLIGIVFYQLRHHIPFSGSIAIGLVGAVILVSVFGNSNLLLSPAAPVIILPLLGYLTVTIGLLPMPRLPGFDGGDYSYGLYLYHVPFLQLLVHYFPEVLTGDHWWLLFVGGLALSLMAAAISWHVIEYPVLRLRNSFVIRHRPESGGAAILLRQATGPRPAPAASLVAQTTSVASAQRNVA
jgi:peptidoglycan/LPS O-acetylase OafA/YrhL